jgi:hypothetical protein
MKAAYEQYELIEQYLTGKLSGSELSAFESRLGSDTLFSEEVQAHKAVHDLVIDQGLLELKAKMKAHEAGYTGRDGKLHIISTIVLVASLTSIGLITSAPVSPAPAGIAVTVPDTNGPNTVAAAGPVIRTEPPLPVTPSSSARPVAASDTIEAMADTTQATHPRVFSADPAIISKRFRNDILFDIMDDILLKDAIPEAVPCRLESSVLKFSTSESCTTSPTGTIIIDKTSLFDGTPPVEFSIDGINFTAGHTFSNLYPGTYYLSVRDAQGCTWFEAKEIIVGEKDCSEREYSFYPYKGEVWKLPVSTSSSGKIEIYSRNGSLVYTSLITHGHPDHWDGTANGHPLPMGSYSFVLKADGKVITGYVTIFK